MAPTSLTLALWQIILLAFVQGAAELLPVSSSAHVIFAQKLMGLDPGAPEMTFLLVMLHTGTMFAVLAFFWRRWREILRKGGRRFLQGVVLATFWTGTLGLALKFLIEKGILEGVFGHEKGEVEHLFRSLPMIGAALFVAGILIFVSGRHALKSKTASKKSDPLQTMKVATYMGLVQGLCLPFRGFSRSGATISTGLLLGARKEWAEDFSFALAVVLTPPVIAQQLHRLHKAQATLTWDMVQPGLVGMLFAAFAGFLALKFLSRVLESGKWHRFAYYCWTAAIVLWIAAAQGY